MSFFQKTLGKFVFYCIWVMSFLLSDEYFKKFIYSTNISKYFRRYQAAKNSSAININLVGYALYKSGYGEHCRNAFKSLKKQSIKLSLFNQDKKYGDNDFDNLELQEHISQDVSKGINIFCLTPLAANKFYKKNHFSKRQTLSLSSNYSVLYGYCEMTNLPLKWVKTTKKFDEIWVPSKYVEQAYKSHGFENIIYMPIAVDFSLSKKYLKADYELPENKFIFLYCFDIIGLERKNVNGLIEAFEKFQENAEGDNSLLCLKISNYGNLEDNSEVEAFKQKVKNKPYIKIIDEDFSKDKLLGLISICDCYTSLHRVEGFGITIAEAMKLERPVITTSYSGNMDFTNAENSFLVDYKLQKVMPEQHHHIDEPDIWADIDINHAAEQMQQVYQNPELAKEKAALAKKFIDENHNFEIVGKRYYKQLKKLSS